VNLTLIKREADKRRLWNTDSAFHHIGCLPLKAVPMSECCDFHTEDRMARSLLPLPHIAENNFGHLIQGVYNVVGQKKLTEMTLNRFINAQRLGLPKKDTYYFIFNGYLYLSNPDVKAVRLRAHFEEDLPSELLFQHCEVCGEKPPACYSPLDQPFASPGYLRDSLLKMVSQNLLQTYFRLNNDKTPDIKDDQVSKT
jgi:hypothetical protein